MKEFYEAILNMNQSGISSSSVSVLKQAWSRVVVPSLVYEHSYEPPVNLRVGNIYCLEHTTSNERRYKVITNVIDQFTDVCQPGWQYIWNWTHFETAVQDGVTR
jgi:hypothetical protein